MCFFRKLSIVLLFVLLSIMLLFVLLFVLLSIMLLFVLLVVLLFVLLIVLLSITIFISGISGISYASVWLSSLLEDDVVSSSDNTIVSIVWSTIILLILYN